MAACNKLWHLFFFLFLPLPLRFSLLLLLRYFKLLVWRNASLWQAVRQRDRLPHSQCCTHFKANAGPSDCILQHVSVSPAPIRTVSPAPSPLRCPFPVPVQFGCRLRPACLTLAGVLHTTCQCQPKIFASFSRLCGPFESVWHTTQSGVKC